MTNTYDHIGVFTTETYRVRPEDVRGGPPGSLGISWPTGFSGTGWLVREGDAVVFASAWRVECLEFIATQFAA